MVLQMKFARQKKRFPLEIYRRIFIPSVISCFTDGKKPLVNLSVNTDRIYPSVKSSVSVVASVKCRRIKSVGKAVGECLKYRPNISVCKCVWNSTVRCRRIYSVDKTLGNSFFLILFLKNYLEYIK